MKQNTQKTEHRCPNCSVLISSGKNLCHACDLELAEWQRKRFRTGSDAHNQQSLETARVDTDRPKASNETGDSLTEYQRDYLVISDLLNHARLDLKLAIYKAQDRRDWQNAEDCNNAYIAIEKAIASKMPEPSLSTEEGEAI